MLRDVLGEATKLGFSVLEVDTERLTDPDHADSIELRLRLRGRHRPTELAATLSEMDGVHAVRLDTEEE